MTDEIRELIKKRRRVFKNIRHTGKWLELKALVMHKVTERKKVMAST